MLTAAPLTELLKMSRDGLKETCPWIPQRILAELYKAINWCSELDGDLSVHSFVQSLNQQCSQMPVYSSYTVEPSPYQISVATSEFNSSPDSVVSNRSSPVVYADYRRDLPSQLDQHATTTRNQQRRCFTFQWIQPSTERRQSYKEYYFTDVSSSLRLRPEELSKSQYREPGITEYLQADSRETGVNHSVPTHATKSSDFPRVREYEARPPRREREDDFFPEALWNASRLSQKPPDDYRVQDVSQASVKRSADTDIPSKRTRQAVRVLDLGNDGSRTLPTKVGIAQPQRRVYGSTGPYQASSIPHKSSQVLGENSVASQHKRFSLGIDRSTKPYYESFTTESDEWSIFPSYLSSKRRKLTYEKIPGVESGGQTKLVFKYDL
ncbi:hypothetical protein OS493_022220 [Desmophyllum pertusum]|uniref:Uncharacterized protein n=1 Tax=Desmophyllum pertusum TaxID=174260 RepID=A0A9X0CE91_9CNID|nr:hypothetical protein OS493_022220 [Desmophyllum pertusum]